MKFLAHRGPWNTIEEKNSLQALSSAFALDIGIETDIRDSDGKLVISHDPPKVADGLDLEVLLQNYLKFPTRPLLALNIKADGLHAPLMSMLRRYSIDNFFVFDMSVPDTLGYQQLQIPFAARISEYELSNPLTRNAAWIWLDAFHSDWFDNALVEFWLDKQKKVAIVSPELHRRPHLPLWRRLKGLGGRTPLYLCTDLLSEAKEFFDAGKN
jgi:glycerophosphoryl diester phosphodiesterase